MLSEVSVGSGKSFLQIRQVEQTITWTYPLGWPTFCPIWYYLTTVSWAILAEYNDHILPVGHPVGLLSKPTIGWVPGYVESQNGAVEMFNIT